MAGFYGRHKLTRSNDLYLPHKSLRNLRIEENTKVLAQTNVSTPGYVIITQDDCLGVK